MGAKATFIPNPPQPGYRIIKLTEAPTLVNGEYAVTLDVQIDLYGDMKEDWLNDPSFRQYFPPIRVVGGDPLPGSKTLGDTYFLRSDWKIEPYDADQRLTVEGNLYSEDGTSPFIKPSGGTYAVQIERSVSNIVDSTIAQLPEIQFSSYQDVVTINVAAGSAGIDYPHGTRQHPVNNLADAITIANSLGLTTLYIQESLTITTGEVLNDFTIIGENALQTYLQIDEGATITSCEIRNCTLNGYLDGSVIIRQCYIRELYYVSGFIWECIIDHFISIDNGATECYVLNSSGGQPNLINKWPAIHVNSGALCTLDKYSGILYVKDKTGTETMHIHITSGEVNIENTCTAGEIHIAGVGELINNSGGSTVMSSGYLQPSLVALDSTVVARPTLSQIEASTVLAKEATVAALPTLSQIEASTVLAKEATLALIKIKTDGLPNGIVRNAPLDNFEFAMIDATDHISFKEGLTSITSQRSIDGAGFVATTYGCLAVGRGVYKINLSAADLNGHIITLLFTAPGADARLITLVTS